MNKIWLWMLSILGSSKKDTPINFKIKIVPTPWGGDSIYEFVYFKYSLNGGKTWDTVHYADSPLLDDETWTWKKFSPTLKDAEKYYIQKLNTYEKILVWEKEQRTILEREKENLKKKREQEKIAKQERLNRINKLL